MKNNLNRIESTRRPTRRRMLKQMAAAVAAAPMINRGRYPLFAHSTAEYSARAVDLVKRSLVIDMLSPLTLNFPKQAKWFANPETFTAADLQPFKDSGIHVFHIAVGVGGPEAYTDHQYSDAEIEGILGGNFKRVLSQIWPS